MTGLGTLFQPSIDTLQDIKTNYENCTQCDNLCSFRSGVVFWDGPDQAKVMMVGEAPGAKEDQLGIPFMGPAGQRLNDMLRYLGIDRRKLHITNSVLCRPTDKDKKKNLKPTKENMEACNDRLMNEIRLVDPEIIVCTGLYPAVAVLGVPMSSRVGELRNSGYKSITLHNRTYTVKVTWHPSYELRNRYTEKGPTIRKEMAEDWMGILKMIPSIGI